MFRYTTLVYNDGGLFGHPLIIKVSSIKIFLRAQIILRLDTTILCLFHSSLKLSTGLTVAALTA